jgi:DNA primase
MFPQSFIQKIKEATDMKKLAEMYTDEPMKKTGDGVWQSKCPHPDHNERTPSFTVWSKFNSWACYGCHNGRKSEKDHNYGSDCIAFMQWIEGCTWREAVLKLAELNNIAKPSSANDKEYKNQLDLANNYHNNLISGENNHVLDYLYARGLDLNDISDWKIGWDGQKITFPLLDRYKNVLGFTRRWLNMPPGRNDKYRNSQASSIFDKSKYFYGIHKIDQKQKYIRITEGTIDVIKATKYGASNVVCTLGTAFTENHAQIIKRLGLIPVLVYDGDSAGVKAINKAASLLAEIGVFCKVVIMPQGKDLADIVENYGDFLEDFLKSEAIPYGYYQAQEIIREYNTKLYELKSSMYPKIKDILLDVPDTEKNLVSSFLEDELKIKI